MFSLHCNDIVVKTTEHLTYRTRGATFRQLCEIKSMVNSPGMAIFTGLRKIFNRVFSLITYMHTVHITYRYIICMLLVLPFSSNRLLSVATLSLHHLFQCTLLRCCKSFLRSSHSDLFSSK